MSGVRGALRRIDLNAVAPSSFGSAGLSKKAKKQRRGSIFGGLG